jgi:hypothetical protein
MTDAHSRAGLPRARLATLFRGARRNGPGTGPQDPLCDSGRLARSPNGIVGRTIAIGALAIGLIVAGCGTTQQSASPASAVAATATPHTATEAPTPAPTPISLKVMTFNIEYGGDEVDFARIVEAVTKAAPDVVGVQEAEGNIAKLAKALGWPYLSARTQTISKLPIIDPAGADGAYMFIEAAFTGTK